MGDAKSIKERGILEQVIKSELDFITYVDVHTGTFHVIVTNDDTDVTPPPEGDYTPVCSSQGPGGMRGCVRTAAYSLGTGTEG